MDDSKAVYRVKTGVRHDLILEEDGEIFSFYAMEKTTSQLPEDSLTDATVQQMLDEEKDSYVDVAASMRYHRQTGVIAGAFLGGVVTIANIAANKDMSKIPESILGGGGAFVFGYLAIGELMGQIGKFANKRHNRAIGKRIKVLEGFIARSTATDTQQQE